MSLFWQLELAKGVSKYWYYRKAQTNTRCNTILTQNEEIKTWLPPSAGSLPAALSFMPGYLVVQKGKVRQKKLLASGGGSGLVPVEKEQETFLDLPW
jgi:hypothetical protein